MPVHDLSYPLETGMPVYPGSPPVAVEPAATVEDDGYATTGLSFDSHTGTHIDSPAHMRSDGPTLDDFDVERFRFRAVLADCRPLEPREPIGADDLERAVAAVADADVDVDVDVNMNVDADTNANADVEADTDADIDAGADTDAHVDATTTGDENGDPDLLICQTGWETHWGTDRAFDHPYLTAAAADWLVERTLDLGIDAMNVDPTPGSEPVQDEPDNYPFHRTMFADDRLLLENLRGLEALPAGEAFTVHAYPLAVANGDGAPVRAVAVLG
ncbi:cyclase family protein [Natronosalvus halobius]|uniref:cyclase family protein n=1 Tax=Natronosalvus halobius TaxID=2953746 RepID=UPI00209FF4FE|nr:cyclase family protein [Natronosalvus halobius]USZ72800.1 cyclase family protein [Natronosalvus halobius]